MCVCVCVQTKEHFGKGNNQNVPEQLDQESSITFEIYSDYSRLKVSRKTLRTIDSFLEQSRSIQSILLMLTISTTMMMTVTTTMMI